MRIAIVNWSRRLAGGAETYLNSIVPELCGRGHELAFLHEVDTPTGRARIEFPDSTPHWCIAAMGAEAAIAALRNWRPDLIYMHSSIRQDWISETVDTIPTVFFCHDYVGTCISGNKSFRNPIERPCERRFGAQCLLHYYPHRCGGWSPVTMWSDYRKQSSRLDLLRRCGAVLTASEAMRREYLKHGFEPERVHLLPFYASPEEVRRRLPLDDDQPPRLLFAARMERLKGGAFLLRALPRAAEELGRPLHVTFAGDGSCRSQWERQAAGLNMPIEFTGWIGSAELRSRMAASDLLVIPSIWPEPFGLVGIEAGMKSLPAAAFAVGGIPDWLHAGVNGYLAPGDPPTPSGLARAIVECLRDPIRHGRLREGAYETASRFTLEDHMKKLLAIFEKTLHG